MSIYDASPSEPHAFLAGFADENLCRICGDDEGGDLHVSLELRIYFVSAGDTLAEALQSNLPFDSYESARSYVIDNFGSDVDVESMIYFADVTVQAFDLERLSDHRN